MKNDNTNKKDNKSSKNTLNYKTFENKFSHSEQRIETDPDGSWTGVPKNPFDTPIQDADDL